MTVAEFLAWPGDASGRRFQLVDDDATLRLDCIAFAASLCAIYAQTHLA